MSVQRSGSNWLHRCLNTHSDILINGELNPSAMLVRLRDMATGDAVSMKKLTDEGAFKTAAVNYVRGLMEYHVAYDSKQKNVQYIADKTAFPCVLSDRTQQSQIEYIQVVRDYFPDAKKILLVRDARDTVVSFSEWKKQPIGSLLKPTPVSFLYFIRHMNNWCRFHACWVSQMEGDSNSLIIHYNQLKHDFRNTMCKVFKFIDVDVDEVFLDMLERECYSIKSAQFEEENRKRGYAFFRSGKVGEWRDKFKWYHKVVMCVFFNKKVEAIEGFFVKQGGFK